MRLNTKLWLRQPERCNEIKKLRSDLGLPCSTIIQGDNKGSISWATDWQLIPRSNHIDVLHHFIEELVEDGRFRVAYVNTKDNCADPFTKSLEPAAFWQFVRMHDNLF